MIRACTASVISTNGTSRSNAISGTPRASASDTRAEGSDDTYRCPSSTASPATPAPASPLTYSASKTADDGSAIPVESTSSPPRSSRPTSDTSATCTQRTGTSSRSAAATTAGAPRRTASSASTSRNVSGITTTLQHKPIQHVKINLVSMTGCT
jgi:hypothetical protein